MKMQLLVATAIATWLIFGASGELSAQQTPGIEVQVLQLAQDAGDAAKDEEAGKMDGGGDGDEDNKKGDDDGDKDDEDKKGKGDDDGKGDKGHKGKGKGGDGSPVIIINIYINGEAVVGGHGKSKD